MRLEAEGVDFGADVGSALVVVGPVGELSLNATPANVSGASGAHDGDVKGCRAGLSKVVDDDVTRAPVVAANQTCNFMLNDDTCGVKDVGEGVDDVVVALMEEAGLLTGGLVLAVGVVGVTTVAARWRFAVDVAELELDDLLEAVGGDFRTKVLVGDSEVDGVRDQTRGAQDTSARFFRE